MTSEVGKRRLRENAKASRPGRRKDTASEAARRLEADRIGRKLVLETMKIRDRRVARSNRAEAEVAKIEAELLRNGISADRAKELERRRSFLAPRVMSNLELSYLQNDVNDRWGTPKRSQVEQLVDKIPPVMLVLPDGVEHPAAKYARPPQAEEEAATNVPH